MNALLVKQNLMRNDKLFYIILSGAGTDKLQLQGSHWFAVSSIKNIKLENI